jgi:hypothetical protein
MPRLVIQLRGGRSVAVVPGFWVRRGVLARLGFSVRRLLPPFGLCHCLTDVGFPLIHPFGLR